MHFVYSAIQCCCVFWPAFRCCAHSKAGQNTFFSHFKLISGVKSLKKVYNEQKRLNMAEKSVLPANGCAQHPKAGQNTQHTAIWYLSIQHC